MRGPARRCALLVGTAVYSDPDYPPLHSAIADVAQLAQALEHPSIGGFDDVRHIIDPTADTMRQAISDFLQSLLPDDLCLLYVSGHGERATTGEYVFVAADTAREHVTASGVGASFVDDLLGTCAAQQKVVVLDACHSGGYAVGFRTAKSAATRPPAPLTTRGVFVMSSSGEDELSWTGAPSANGPLPSAFTGEIIEALRTGHGDTDGDGVVSVAELFHYVNDRLRRRPAPTPQVPVYSSIGVSGRIDIARAYTGLPLPPARLQATASLPTAPAKSVTPDASTLLAYYRQCVVLSDGGPPLLPVDDSDDSYVCLSGSEQLLSGDLDDGDSIPLPDEAVQVVERTLREGGELWYGYPAVVLLDKRIPRFAPLLMRRVEVTEGPDGPRLRPVGEPKPHAGLADERGAEGLVETFRASWQAGSHSQLVREIRHVLREDLSLEAVQELRPAELEPAIDIRTPASGARNAAVLLALPPAAQAAAKLVADLDHIARRPETIGRTALAAMFGGPRDADTRPWTPVTPLRVNDAQLDVLASAMTNRLTTATGPPGTGKTQLVANVVATALANNQSVLVASTMNRAVDEVWQRCCELAPGSVIRTGSVSGERNNRQDERDGLRELVAMPPPTTTLATVQSSLAQAQAAENAVRERMAHRAELDKRLLDCGQRREAAARDLGGALDPRSSPAELARRGERLARARLFGRLRRSRWLRSIGSTAEPAPQSCAVIAAWARCEDEWRTGIAAARPGDDNLAACLNEAADRVRQWSTALLAETVRAAAAGGRHAVQALFQAQGKDWAELRTALPAVRGWAVTALSARRFPTDPALFDLVVVDEASQCAVPHMLPLLYRAKRALIIGDVMQLPPVITLRPAQEADVRRSLGLRADWLDARRLVFHRHSAFHAAEAAVGGTLLLDEHFRCHPAIARLASTEFYGGALTVLTDVAAQRGLDREAIIWRHTTGTAERGRGGSWRNRAEADVVVQSVRYLVNQLPDASIGVVTPYAAQAALITAKLRDLPAVRVGTAHKFQGGERDVMVLSLVAGPAMPRTSGAWLNGQLQLWNVAITRARSHLIVIGDETYWTAAGGFGAVLRATANTDTIPAPHPDELLTRLHTRLGPAATLLEPVNGYLADAVIRNNGTAIPIVLDRGHPDDGDPARHLRLTHHRSHLMAATRVPAWRLYDPSDLL